MALYGTFEQRTAGYILSGVRRHLMSSTYKAYGQMLLHYLSVFEIETRGPTRVPTDDAIFSIASNIISRGNPTIPSLRVERTLASLCNLTHEVADRGSIEFPIRDAYHKKERPTCWRALVPVDPRFSSEEVAAAHSERLESEAERRFFSVDAPRYGGEALPQLLELQCPIASLVTTEQRAAFQRQRVDFAAAVPCVAHGTKGIVVEVDGRQHRKAGQASLDQKRDTLFRQYNLDVLRCPASDAGFLGDAEAAVLRSFWESSYVSQAERNITDPLHASADGRRWLQALLSPIVVARVQKTLVDLVLSGNLDVDAPVWNIVVLERDVPGSALAVDDLRELLGHLLVLEGKGRQVPEINLRVYRSREFTACALGQDDVYGIIGEEVGEPFKADVLLDVSVLQRPGLSETESPYARLVSPGGVRCTIRTAYSPRAGGTVKGGRPLAYDLVADVDAMSARGDLPATQYGDKQSGIGALTYVLQNVFRKEQFRPKQLDVIARALRGDSVIGLLPTGAGKSLCYQMASLLQPGTTLVVAPLKSLMQDQDANLKRLGITSSAFLNSSLKTGERVRVEREITEGRYQFVFVAPERFLIKAFRDVLHSLKVPVTYCVIDEAHCVSEWGHDFRTAYLQLAANVRAHCNTMWPTLPLIGLTGTASYDVLSDVRRELEVGAEVEVITPSSFARDELTFEIRSVPRPECDRGADRWTVREAVIEQKRNVLIDVLDELPQRLGKTAHPERSDDFLQPNGADTASGLIFTPHANGAFGVQENAQTIRNAFDLPSSAIACYASSDRQATDEDLYQTQEAFKDNDVSVLVATKAFGMGIDKPNIRFVVHLNMSQSIESYYQEAGRAGRDRQDAVCYILYCDKAVEGSGPATDDLPSLDRDMLLYFHRNSFKGIEKEFQTLLGVLQDEISIDDQSAVSIARVLSEMRTGEQRMATIDFASNKVIPETTAYLCAQVDQRFRPGMVKAAIRKCTAAKDFSKKLMAAFMSSVGSWPKNYIEPGSNEAGQLAEFFRQLRSEEDTFKAVYRLSIIGLVKDYTVDYNVGVIEATIRKRPDVEYIEALRGHIARYVAPERARRVPEEVLAMEGETVIQKCLRRLIAFVYGTIARKRSAAIDVMEEAVREGAKDGVSAFEQRVSTYFDSRYLPEMQVLFPERSFDLDVLWNYIEKTEGTDDNVNHLRGACDRLLGDHPESPVLYLLRAFTRVMTAGGAPEVFRKDFRVGWDLLNEVSTVTRGDYLDALHRFNGYVAEYNAELKEVLNEEVIHAHTAWLTGFNNKFLSAHHA